MSADAPHPIARVVLAGLVQEGEVIRLSEGLRPELEAAIIAAIEDRSLRAAIDELVSLTAHLHEHGAGAAAQALMSLLHGLVTTLEVATLSRGSKRIESTEAIGAPGALIGTRRARPDAKLGEKATRPWWTVRANKSSDDEGL